MSDFTALPLGSGDQEIVQRNHQSIGELGRVVLSPDPVTRQGQILSLTLAIGSDLGSGQDWTMRFRRRPVIGE